MKFVHQREHLNEDSIMVIECSQQCNTHPANDASLRSFKNGGRYSYRGDAFGRFPTKIKVPSTGFWNVATDTVIRRLISVMRRPGFKWSVKFVRRFGS